MTIFTPNNKIRILARHYLVDAYITDERMKSLLLLINALFEQESVRRKHTQEQRFKFRLKYSRKMVEKIMKKLESIRKLLF